MISHSERKDDLMKKVALVKGDDRKKNIRKALENIRADIDIKGRRPVIKVNFVSTHEPLCATHVDATRTVVEFLKDLGVHNIAVAEAATFGTRLPGIWVSGAGQGVRPGAGRPE